MIFQEARKRAAQWQRWVRKAPHNRVQKKWLRNEQHQKIGSEVVGSLPEPETCDLFSEKLVDTDRNPLGRWFDGYIRTDNAVEKEYQKARKPRRSPEDVEESKMSPGSIDGLLAQAEKWYSAV